MTTRVVLVDDQELLRGTFRLLLDATEDIEVVGEAGTGTQAVEVVTRTRPDVVLMDVRMPDMDGVEATRIITADPALTDVHILILTTFEADELVVAAIRAGAAGYLGKGVRPAALLDGIRTVARGESLLSPAATTALIQRFLTTPVADVDAALPPLVDLTDREREVAILAARGLTNDEIANRLVISTATAKTHVNRAMTKVGARDRAQLVVFAYQHRLIRPGDSAP